jgi:hypothetical protein
VSPILRTRWLIEHASWFSCAAGKTARKDATAGEPRKWPRRIASGYCHHRVDEIGHQQWDREAEHFAGRNPHRPTIEVVEKPLVPRMRIVD